MLFSQNLDMQAKTAESNYTAPQLAFQFRLTDFVALARIKMTFESRRFRRFFSRSHKPLMAMRQTSALIDRIPDIRSQVQSRLQVSGCKRIRACCAFLVIRAAFVRKIASAALGVMIDLLCDCSDRMTVRTASQLHSSDKPTGHNSGQKCARSSPSIARRSLTMPNY